MFTLEQIQSHIPQYLTREQQEGLFRDLRDFENRSYYTHRYPHDMLQGDGWTKIEIVRLEDGARDRVKGILLSNSCDIDSTNVRAFPPRIVFAPLVPLQSYAELLSKRLERRVVDDKMSAIRKQRISSLFFLPYSVGLDGEHIAILDDLHSIPLQRFQEEPDRVKMFTLSQMGFYVFLMKLSIHFCRFQEDIARDPDIR
jgi:hypothetical protein